MQLRKVTGFVVFVLTVSACVPKPGVLISTPPPPPTATQKAALAVPPTETPTAVPFESLSIWLDPAVPDDLRAQLPESRISTDKASADLWFGIDQQGDKSVAWTYALVTSFSSLLDEVSMADLQSYWSGLSAIYQEIYAEPSTIAALAQVLGQPGPLVKPLAGSELLAAVWNNPSSLAVVPFEQLEPRWKVLGIDGQSPVHNDFVAELYPLTIYFGWGGTSEGLAALENTFTAGILDNLKSNRDPDQLTVLVMTGVTALVRATAVRMEEKGMTYPGEAIRDWLIQADMTHISNEVSFAPECPDPVSYPGALIFCSKPEYIELLDFVGTDILELTGNHGIDWGRKALTYSLGLYKDRNWLVYAAGEDLSQAREAVTTEHNGNKLAFIGCNPAGPSFIWASETQSGVANCDYPWMWQRISQLKAEGYNVIATFQYFETYRHYVEPFEETDFRSMADAGAVIVSGSQAHHPMAMEFYQGSFIHYGLGNLFFDQMHTGGQIPDATRKEFIDRYIFYNNRHISTELLTAMLEDYAQPRPMTPAERADFLTEIFNVTRWGDVPMATQEK